jgi:FAD/FMN-containing dehydrogenase
LQRSGYRFDSSFTADDVLTNFPYALPLGLLFEEDSGLYEFPVTIDDSDDPPLIQRVDQALEVIRANAENGAPNVILIHTNESQGKLLAEEALLRGLPPGVVATDMESFARFWRARDRLRWTARTTKDPSSMELDVTSDEAIDGLTIEFRREIADLRGGAKLLPDRRRILLPILESGGHTHLQIRFHNCE